MKYIVYLTTNLKSLINNLNRILIGVHLTENPYIFDNYLGEGVWANLTNTFKYPKTPFLFAVKKYGATAFRRETLYIFNTAKQAYNKLLEILDEDFLKLDHVYNGLCINNSKVHQFNKKGELVKIWNNLFEIQEHFNTSLERIIYALNDRTLLFDSFWFRNNKFNPNYEYIHIETINLYNKNGKWLRQFSSKESCSKFTGFTINEITEAIKTQNIVGDYYITNFIRDEFNPKPRRQYKFCTFYVYQNGECLGSFKGKKVMNVINMHSWQKLKIYVEIYNGWYKDFYISLNPVDKIPEKVILQIDVYDKTFKYIETLNSLKEVKEKYQLTNKQIKDIQLGDKYAGEYIFKYKNNK